MTTNLRILSTFIGFIWNLYKSQLQLLPNLWPLLQLLCPLRQIYEYFLHYLDLSGTYTNPNFTNYLICVHYYNFCGHYDKFTNTFYIYWIYLEPPQIPTSITT